MSFDGIDEAAGCRPDVLRYPHYPLAGKRTMFLGKERPLALLLQLSGIGLLAYDLFASEPQASGAAAVAGLGVFVVGTLISRAHL